MSNAQLKTGLQGGVQACIAMGAILLGTAAGGYPDDDAPASHKMCPDNVLHTYQTRHFSIHHDRSAAWAVKLGRHLEVLSEEFYEEMTILGAKRPEHLADDRLEWWCVRQGRPQGPDEAVRFDARYDTRQHRVELVWTPGHTDPQRESDAVGFEPAKLSASTDGHVLLLRVSHEMAHQLAFDSGLMKRGVMYPLWLAEGLATNLESSDSGMRFMGPNPARRARLYELADCGGLMPLERLATVTSTRGLNRRQRIDIYAQAWAFFRFLASERAPALKQHLRKLATQPYGKRSESMLRNEMASSFGGLEALEQDWRAWLADR